MYLLYCQESGLNEPSASTFRVYSSKPKPERSLPGREELSLGRGLEARLSGYMMSDGAIRPGFATTSVDSLAMEVLFPVDVAQKLNFQRAVN